MKKGTALMSLIFLSVGFIWGAQDITPGIEGIWLGSFSAGGMELRLVFHITKSADGSFSGTMDSPDQGAAGITMDPVTFKDGVLTATWAPGQFTYTGKLSEDGLNLTGSFTQGGATYELNMRKVKELPPVIRPQDPKKPYPYKEEEVEYKNERDGIKLAATLTLPKEGGPFPAVVLITGSGAQDRNEEVMGHRPFLVLADHLTRKGIAVLRADDRGVGGTTGNISLSTTENFAFDALAGVAYLQSRPEIDSTKIGLAGHSEGGIIAPLVASMSDDIAFIVLMAGTGLTGEEILYLQAALIAASNGTPEDKIEENRQEQKKIFAVLKSDKSDKEIKQDLTAMFKQDYAAMSDEEKKSIPDTEAYLERQFNQLLSPWFRFFLTYDPKPTLEKVKCPVLALNGEKDLQVPPKENLEAIEGALREGGNKDYSVKMLPGLNHLFQKAGTGAPSEYAQIPETINPAALNTISAWLLERFKK
jgi:fermentation-respiration switch protein FrsA (DUF1100 family)